MFDSSDELNKIVDLSDCVILIELTKSVKRVSSSFPIK